MPCPMADMSAVHTPPTSQARASMGLPSFGLVVSCARAKAVVRKRIERKTVARFIVVAPPEPNRFVGNFRFRAGRPGAGNIREGGSQTRQRVRRRGGRGPA